MLIDKVANIGLQLQSTTSEQEISELQSQLNELKPEMLRNGLILIFDFGEDPELWEKKIQSINSTLNDFLYTQYTPNDEDWHIKHQLKWGCNVLTYCTDNFPEWYDLGDYSSITWTMPTLYQIYVEIKHLVINFKWNQCHTEYGGLGNTLQRYRSIT